MCEGKQGRVRLGSNKTKSGKQSTEAGIPCTGRLLMSIERSLKLAHVGGKSRILKTGRLLHIDSLREKTVEEGIAHINLPEARLSTPGFLTPDAYYAIRRNPRKNIFARHNTLISQ